MLQGPHSCGRKTPRKQPGGASECVWGEAPACNLVSYGKSGHGSQTFAKLYRFESVLVKMSISEVGFTQYYQTKEHTHGSLALKTRVRTLLFKLK